MKEREFENLLRQAMQPEINSSDLAIHVRYSRKGNHMKQIMKKVCVAAAAVMLLTTTVYAAGTWNIKTLLSGGSSKTYATVEQAEEKAGFEMDAKESFENGYTIASVRVTETKALDKNDKVRLTYPEIGVMLCNADGETLSLTAHEYHEEIVDSSLPPQQSRILGDISVSYRLHHYKFVPEDYELTEADKAMLQQPGNFLSYGADSVEEHDVAFLSWEKNGICYLLMDSDASEPVQSLFSMAQELIICSQ